METVIRVVVIYLAILIGLRVLGKREFSQLSPLELVALLLIPELVQQALIRDDTSMTNALVALSTLFGMVFLTSAIAHTNKRAEAVLAGVPVVLVDDGKFLPKNMNRERVTPDEILTEMHKSGLETLDQVRWAVLESDGQIAIIPHELNYQTVAKRDEPSAAGM